MHFLLREAIIIDRSKKGLGWSLLPDGGEPCTPIPSGCSRENFSFDGHYLVEITPPHFSKDLKTALRIQEGVLVIHAVP